MTAAVNDAWTVVTAVMDKPGVEIYHVPLTIRTRSEGGQWASWCEELGVHSCGDSIGEAIDNAVDATLTYLNTIEGLSERRRVFKEREIEPRLGWPADETIVDHRSRPGEIVSHMVAGNSSLVG